MKNELTVTVEVSDAAADAIMASVLPEIDSDTHERTAIKMSRQGGRLALTIRAKDLHAMRAAANTYLRWLDMCAKLAE
jgi:tRNA threonylcarbamoyladenosine modification (KEOPS) complex  Pcc1 subunit